LVIAHGTIGFLTLLYVVVQPILPFLFSFSPPIVLSADADVYFTFVSPDNCPVYLSVLCLFKDEAPYLAEWIEYHLLIGIERFWLINNDSQDHYRGVLRPYIAAGIVKLVHERRPHMQIPLYNRWIPRLRNKTFWLAVIDVDEFIVPLNHDCLHDLFHRYEPFAGIDMNWMIYGYNGQMRKRTGLVIERFPNHVPFNEPRNTFTKTIVNPRVVRRMQVHHAKYFGGRYAMTPCGLRSANRPWERPACHKVLRINHYLFKSYKEWQVKVRRGRTTSLGKYPLEMIFEYVDNVTDDRVMDRFIPRVNENLHSPFTNPPCHLAGDSWYYEKLQRNWERLKQNRPIALRFAWLRHLGR
jgi:hypothetical protein